MADANSAVEFYPVAFGAVALERLKDDAGILFVVDSPTAELRRFDRYRYRAPL
jgi:hypothetical protein